MKLPKLQFKVRGLLLATFWIAVGCSSLVVVNRLHKLRVSTPLENVLTLVIMITPFLALGALLGRSLTGALIGVVTLSLFWLIFYLT